MGLMDVTRDLGRANRDSLKRNKILGWVIANKHPEADKDKRQMVKIRVPRLHKGIPDADLPWALPRQQGGSTAAGAGGKDGEIGMVNVPPIGSKLFLTYDSDDPHVVYYGGSPTTEDVTQKHPLLKDEEDYPDTYGEQNQVGDLWKVNTKKKLSNYTHNSGSFVNFDKDGNVTIAAHGTLTLSGKVAIVEVSDGPISSHAKGVHSSKGSSVHHNGGDSAAKLAETKPREAPQIDRKQGLQDIT